MLFSPRLESPHNFNSHAHVERDNYPLEFDDEQKISTHTLTWSVTKQYFAIGSSIYHFNSHAHVERDENDLKFVDTKINFNSHAHVERDWHFYFMGAAL